MNKYHNRKITVDGQKYDSVKEYSRYCELKLLERAGIITELTRQVKFVLIPAQYENGRCVERECSYYADFTYREDGEFIVEDVKGKRTKEYIIKRKLMLKIYGYRIKET